MSKKDVSCYTEVWWNQFIESTASIIHCQILDRVAMYIERKVFVQQEGKKELASGRKWISRGFNKLCTSILVLQTSESLAILLTHTSDFNKKPPPAGLCIQPISWDLVPIEERPTTSWAVSVVTTRVCGRQISKIEPEFMRSLSTWMRLRTFRAEMTRVMLRGVCQT